LVFSPDGLGFYILYLYHIFKKMVLVSLLASSLPFEPKPEKSWTVPEKYSDRLVLLRAIAPYCLHTLSILSIPNSHKFYPVADAVFLLPGAAFLLPGAVFLLLLEISQID
jgi:hypothetical protein